MRDARDSVSQSDPLKVYTCAKGLTKVRVLGHCPFSVVFSSMGDVKDVRDFAMNSNLVQYWSVERCVCKTTDLEY